MGFFSTKGPPKCHFCGKPSGNNVVCSECQLAAEKASKERKQAEEEAEKERQEMINELLEYIPPERKNHYEYEIRQESPPFYLTVSPEWPWQFNQHKHKLLEPLKMMLEKAKIIQQLMQETPPDKAKPWEFYELKSIEALTMMLEKVQAREKRLEEREQVRGERLEIKERRAAMVKEASERSQQASETIKAMESILANGLRQNHASVSRNMDSTTAIQYKQKTSEGVSEYFEKVLSSSYYPLNFPKRFDLDYNTKTNMLIVNYSLPNINLVPKIKDVKYVKPKNEVVEVPLEESTVNRLYDNVVYQIALRTLYEIFESDAESLIETIVLNGWVESIDKATGRNVNKCIVSIQTNRQEFSQIDLANVDPKACFKKLKGIGSPALYSWTAIAPIVSISREDKRFVQGYEVAKDLEESFNLASMPWEDFEHLVREVFDREFSQYGGEVKVTRASRDGGIDAIAFDPDPIRGGKIAIQAKRYTHTVGVAAVRDLYGTVINEGATKGILVTTSDYGSDAHEFAKGKPITLLNGNHLLHLLQKHGYRAKIDLEAARQILTDNKSTKQ